MSEKLKLTWITNASREDVKSGEVKFVNGIEGQPKPTEKHTSEELSKMGMIGIYKQPGDSSFETIARVPCPIKPF